MQSPCSAGFLFIPSFLCSKTKALLTCSNEVKSVHWISLPHFIKYKQWIKHTLVISQGLEPCHAHINYYRSSICDCPSVALATYWMHPHFTEYYTPARAHTHKMHTSASVLPCPSKPCTIKKFSFNPPDVSSLHLSFCKQLPCKNSSFIKHFLYCQSFGEVIKPLTPRIYSDDTIIRTWS